MLISYLCGICQTIQLVSLLIGMSLGGHILVTVIMNTIAATSYYEENRKQIILPKIEKVLCVIFILLALFVPSNLQWDLIDEYKKDLQEQRQELLKANQQITEFKLFLETNNLEDKYIEFDKQFNER